MPSIRQVASSEWLTGPQISVRELLGRLQSGSVRQMIATHEQRKQSRLQFRLRGFSEHQSTDDLTGGNNDEVYLSALGVDSSTAHVGPDGRATVEVTRASMIGDISSDPVRDPWKINPHVLLEFTPYKPGDWPRTYTVTLLLVEEDQQSLAESFDALYSQVGSKVREAVSESVSVGAGAIVGSLIPGVGTIVGAAIGALAGPALDAIIGAIIAGFRNDVFTPRSLVLTVAHPAQLWRHPEVGQPRTLRIEEHGAIYDLEYDWHITG